MIAVCIGNKNGHLDLISTLGGKSWDFQANPMGDLFG